MTRTLLIDIAAIAIVGAMVWACYDEPQPDAPACEEHGVTVAGVEPDSNVCFFANKDLCVGRPGACP